MVSTHESRPDRPTTPRDGEEVLPSNPPTTDSETTPLLPSRSSDDTGETPASSAAIDEEQGATSTPDSNHPPLTTHPPFLKHLPLYHKISLLIALALPTLLTAVLLVGNLLAPPFYSLPYRITDRFLEVMFASFITIAWAVNNLVRNRRRPGTFLPLGVGVMIHGLLGVYMVGVAFDSSYTHGECYGWGGDGDRIAECRAWARKFHVLVWGYLGVLHGLWYVVWFLIACFHWRSVFVWKLRNLN